MKRTRNIALASVVTLVVCGVVASVVGASAVARHDDQKTAAAFATASADLASSVGLGLQHEQDLIVSTAAFAVTNPAASESAFRHWVSVVRAFHRYPELSSFGESVLVPAAKLSAFEVRAARALKAPPGSTRPFALVPPGVRPFYCLSEFGQSRDPRTSVPAGYDFCDSTDGATLASRDRGRGTYGLVTLGGLTTLAIEMPVYRAGVVPTTVAARRSSFQGWIGVALRPNLLLDPVLGVHPGITLSLRYLDELSHVAFSDGTPPTGAQHILINLDNGWSIETFTARAPTGVFAHPNAFALMGAGSGLSVVLGLLVIMLLTSRGRALALVGSKSEELLHQSLHDPLTGLPNRALVIDRIERLQARGLRQGTVVGAMFIDLDDFKNVNDTLGHAAGDQLLLAVAKRLEGALHNTDTIGRMGGDEFVVLVDGGISQAGAELVSERLLEVMRQPFEIALAPLPLTVTASVGVAVGDRSSPGELLRDADVALYLAKSAGKNCAEIFRARSSATIRERYELEFDLRRALEEEEFTLVYQPIYRLGDLCLVGVEALLRWEHPIVGTIQPNEFIPVLEANGQIIKVGRWVLNKACLQMADWHARGSEVTLSVNVSGRQLESDGIVDDVRDALELSGLDAASLTIEVTETVLMRNTDNACTRLHELKKLGVEIAIDDFGTGFSSLAYLQKFPVDCRKIDRMFTSSIGHSRESRALVRTLVQLGRNLGLTVLAEGVETKEQIDHLRAELVDRVQGFHMARPLDPETLAKTLLQSHTGELTQHPHTARGLDR